LRHFVRRGIHSVPQRLFLRIGWSCLQSDQCARLAVVVRPRCPAERDTISWIGRLLVTHHLTDAAQGANDPRDVEIAEVVEEIDIRHLLEEVRLRVHAQFANARGGDLDVEMSE